MVRNNTTVVNIRIEKENMSTRRTVRSYDSTDIKGRVYTGPVISVNRTHDAIGNNVYEDISSKLKTLGLSNIPRSVPISGYWDKEFPTSSSPEKIIEAATFYDKISNKNEENYWQTATMLLFFAGERIILSPFDPENKTNSITKHFLIGDALQNLFSRIIQVHSWTTSFSWCRTDSAADLPTWLNKAFMIESWSVKDHIESFGDIEKEEFSAIHCNPDNEGAYIIELTGWDTGGRLDKFCPGTWSTTKIIYHPHELFEDFQSLRKEYMSKKPKKGLWRKKFIVGETSHAMVMHNWTARSVFFESMFMVWDTLKAAHDQGFLNGQKPNGYDQTVMHENDEAYKNTIVRVHALHNAFDAGSDSASLAKVAYAPPYKDPVMCNRIEEQLKDRGGPSRNAGSSSKRPRTLTSQVIRRARHDPLNALSFLF